MPPPGWDISLYGPAGGELRSRLDVQNDPDDALVISCAGPQYSTRPGHELGLSGSSYRYTPAYSANNGTKNLITGDGFLVSIPAGNNQFGTIASTRDAYIFNTPVGWSFYTQAGVPPLFIGGSSSSSTTTSDSFTIAGTVQRTSGNKTIVGTGTAFTTTTVAGYTYTPSMKNPQIGDIITIGGTEYAIVFVTDATHVDVYPTPTVTDGGGQAYTIKRYGWPSRSNIVLNWTLGRVYSVTNQSVNSLSQIFQPSGTIAAHAINTGNYVETAPQHTPSNTDVVAYDIALYKSFLLYGFGSSIGWSVAGFPTADAFGATDFPDINITVVDPGDAFVGFEYLGDQLVALFRKGLWLVVPTGLAPPNGSEFNFYRLPENRGALDAVSFVQTGNELQVTSRPHCSAPGAIYYLSIDGVIEFTGSIGTLISEPLIDELALGPGAGGIGATPVSMFWDQALDTVFIVAKGNVFRPNCFGFSRKTREWKIFDLGSTGTNPFTGALFGIGITPQPWSLGWWDTGSKTMLQPNGKTIYQDGVLNTNSALPWQYQSPVINLSSQYKKWQFTGFSIDAHGDTTQTTQMLNWQVWAGTTPYNMIQEDAGTYNYVTGTPARDIVGKKIDKPFIGIILSGNNYIKLSRLLVYDVRTDARR